MLELRKVKVATSKLQCLAKGPGCFQGQIPADPHGVYYMLALGARMTDVHSLFTSQISTKILIGILSNKAFISPGERTPSTLPTCTSILLAWWWPAGCWQPCPCYWALGEVHMPRLAAMRFFKYMQNTHLSPLISGWICILVNETFFRCAQYRTAAWKLNGCCFNTIEIFLDRDRCHCKCGLFCSILHELFRGVTVACLEH